MQGVINFFQESIFVLHFLLVMALGWYAITTLQWYSYRLSRVITKFSRPKWHFLYFIVPVVVYYISLGSIAYWIYFLLGFLPSFLLWYFKVVDKKLVITGRVKRFFIILVLLTMIIEVITLKAHLLFLDILTPLIGAILLSWFTEKLLFWQFYKRSKTKLQSMPSLKIVAITASFGKTSIKNFLYQLVNDDYNVYKTPRSVNTLAGLTKDVNEDLPLATTLYIAEAGAREKGDILEIVDFLEPHYVICGVVGEQHMDYFKTLDNVKKTKSEILRSHRLIHAWTHESLMAYSDEKVSILSSEGDAYLSSVSSTLEGVSFELVVQGECYQFSAPILGGFNAVNIALALLTAHDLGIDFERLQAKVKTLQPIEHRLQKIVSGGKIILDDSFNGNFEGMSEGILLCETYQGRRVIITPGIVECSEELNRQLALRINDVFDLVIITGVRNQTILKESIMKPEVIVLEDKSRLTDILAMKTHAGDLIYFANDAPSFI